MKIGEIGNHFQTTTKIIYQSDSTLLEFDYLIFDLNSITLDINKRSKTIVESRKKNILDFLEHKKIPLIIFAPIPANIQLQNDYININYLLPNITFATETESGNDIEITKNTIFTEFLKRNQNQFNYTVFFSKYEGTVFMETPFLKKTLAFYNSDFVFLPRIKKINDKPNEILFLNDLYEVLLKINPPIYRNPMPGWAGNYFLPMEQEIAENIKELEKQIENLTVELDQKKELVEKIKAKKVLFTGTGNELEFEVKSIFEELGFNVLEAEKNREDLIIKYNDRVAVVEIKGVTGSAAERHAAQLEKWVSNYFENKEIHPKGILLINAFRDIELGNRTEVFPHQMLSYSASREHCLITTAQLLGLYYQVLKDPTQKDELITSLFSTTGVYKDFTDWTQFIFIE